MAFNFDWYGATLNGEIDPDRVAARLLHDSGAVGLTAGRGGFNYPNSYSGSFPGGGTLSVFYGRDKPVYVQGTSAAAAHVADVLRSFWPDHSVSRADVAFDVDEAGSFEKLWPAVHALTKGRAGKPIKSELAGDWLDALHGRTYYAGGRASAFRVRVYEKGHEQRSSHPDQTFSLDWTRVEAQIRPAKSGDKRAAATATPAELFAWTPFGAAVLQVIADLQLTPHSPRRIEATDPEYWLARQYSAVLARWLLLPDADLRAVMVSTLDRALSSPQTAA